MVSTLRRVVCAVAGAGLIAALVAGGADAKTVLEPKELVELTLEQLGEIDVMSVSRRPVSLQDAPASVYVIRAEEIRRSGATSLAEALRLAPNLIVAQVNANTWAITARGFNNASGNKLLVLIDGRVVYTPLFSGVFWDVQEMMLEDIDRIEVVSGPGATLWGTNAVSGVINVITRRAGTSRGVLASATAGDRERGGGAGYEHELASGGGLRFHARYFERDATRRAQGGSGSDAWSLGQAGFRMDRRFRGAEVAMIGNAYTGESSQALPGTQEFSGVNFLARWTRAFSERSELRLQACYDRTRRDRPEQFAETLDIVDVEFQHGLRIAGTHQFVWGAGYRHAFDRVENRAGLAFLPGDRDLRWAQVYAQDEVAIRRDLSVTMGARLETNVYTDAEWLPGLRIAWSPRPHHLLWTAASRPVRAPSRLDRDLFIPGAPPYQLAGGPDFRSERANVYELGYRTQLVESVSFSVTAFRHDYDRLRSFEIADPGSPDTVYVLGNGFEGAVSGAEAWANYRMSPVWRVSAGLLLLDEDLERSPASTDRFGPRTLGNDPPRQWSVRSSMGPWRGVDLDLTLRRVARLPDPRVPAYSTVDARIGWASARGLHVSVAGRNLFDEAHVEWGNPATTASEIERSVLVTLGWRAP